MKFTADQLQRIFPDLPAAKCRAYAPHLSAALEEAKINTRPRACAFLAQLGHESQDLRHLREIWGPTPAQQRYDVRVDLGNTPERDGDGKAYMGRGGLQRTGKKNYRRAQVALNLPLLDHPELLEKPENAFRSDALYWTDNDLNRVADRLTLKGDARDLKQFDKLTHAINGGYNGRVDRQRRYLEAIDVLPAELFTSALTDVQTFAPEGTKPPIGETKAPIVETKPTADETPTDKLLSKLSANNGAKTAGLSLAKRVGLRIGRPLVLVYSALEAGNIFAWFGVAVLVIGLLVLIYYERHAIRRVASRIIERLSK